MKYVIIKACATKTPILFPDWADHRDIAGNHKVVSAGFVLLGEDRTAHPYGKSVSLNIGPADGDKELIEKFLRSED